MENVHNSIGIHEVGAGGRQLEEVNLKCIERARKDLLVTKSQLCNSGERAPTALTGLARCLHTQLEIPRINVQHAVRRKCPSPDLTSPQLLSSRPKIQGR